MLSWVTDFSVQIKQQIIYVLVSMSPLSVLLTDPFSAGNANIINNSSF